MAAPQHVYQIYIKAEPDRVWQAITDPEFTTRYFFRTAIESSLEPGSGHRYLFADGQAAAEGDVEVVEPGRRLVLTWRALYDAELAAEPPGRVEWNLLPANEDGSVTRVQVRHYDLGMSPKTWANVADGWTAILDGMKTLLETGDELGPVEVPEPQSTDDVEKQWHRSLAVTANNASWELLGPTADHDELTLSPDDAFDLLGRAYAAAYHWRRFNGADSINAARAAWLCSRAHIAAGDGTAGLRMARRCAEITAGCGDDAADFDHVYAAEAEARALSCLGRSEEASAAYRQAAALLEKVPDPQDRRIAESDLLSGPWFGLSRPE